MAAEGVSEGGEGAGGAGGGEGEGVCDDRVEGVRGGMKRDGGCGWSLLWLSLSCALASS